MRLMSIEAGIKAVKQTGMIQAVKYPNRPVAYAKIQAMPIKAYVPYVATLIAL